MALKAFADQFNDTLNSVADGLVRSAVAGQQAAEKETTLASSKMLNVPTPATDGFLYLKSKRGEFLSSPPNQVKQITRINKYHLQ